jgi:cation:H+ antiporter
MDMILSIVSFVIGLGLVIYFAEKLVKGAVGTSLGFGTSTFLISVIFIGFDPENLALGAVAAFEDVAGIALGSIIGAAMVAITLAFGITDLFAPMKFGQAPKRVLAVPIWAAVIVVSLFMMRKKIPRWAGAVLIAFYGIFFAGGYLI